MLFLHGIKAINIFSCFFKNLLPYSSSLCDASSMVSKGNGNPRTYRDALSPSLISLPLHDPNAFGNSLNGNQYLSCNQDHQNPSSYAPLLVNFMIALFKVCHLLYSESCNFCKT